MANLQSPGIQIQEIDLTGVVPAVGSTEVAFVGQFNWGPLNTKMLIDSEERLYSTYWGPDSTNYKDWFSASNFLTYGDMLWLVRVGNEVDSNSNLEIKNATAANSHGILVKNNDDYDQNYSTGNLQSTYSTGPWVARYPGALGNSLKVSVCTSANTYSTTLAGTVTIAANSTTVNGTGTSFTTKVQVGDYIEVGGESHQVASIANTTRLTLESAHNDGVTGGTAVRYWEYYANVNVAPGTSIPVENLGGANDEMHIVIVDEDGAWTGEAGQVLETFQFVSKGSDALKEDGTSNYYKDVINSQSRYIRWGGHASQVPSLGHTVSGYTFSGRELALKYSLVGGNDGSAVNDADRIRGYTLFRNTEETKIDIVISGAASQTLAIWLINNLVEYRKDCIVFLSPPQAAVVNNYGDERNDVVAFRNLLPSSSYSAIDGNWKYQYDRYNDVYRWVPCNADIAGIHVASDEARDAWWAAAGLNRGQMKNVIKLAWQPSKSDRDVLYPRGINPIVTFPGQGTYLWGQKTMLNKPSAFDRINVRRLFLILEKAIGEAAKYLLFEFNDAITRAQFVNMVEPYLANIQGRRGIYDFKVVCDETNNTPYIIDTNQFIGDIYIKPARVAEFITLRFIAVPTGIEFSTVIGRF
jgi:phage tail sheath protein FI